MSFPTAGTKPGSGKVSGNSPLSLVAPAWRLLNPSGTSSEAELYQTSLMTALLNGLYEGETTFADLRQHGDFGVGTFNALDGEMICLDGTFHQLRSDGSARLASPDDKTPFSAVTFFKPEKELSVQDPMTKEELLKEIESSTEANLFSAIRIDGRFLEVHTRTVSRQQQPYPSLLEATHSQTQHRFLDTAGTLAGFRSPAFTQGIEVAGFHLHFLVENATAGGHALDYILQEGRIQIATLQSLHVELPHNRQFLGADLTGASIDQVIRSTEG